MLSYTHMPSPFVRRLTHLDLEEKILNSGLVLSIIGLCLPWIGGRWLGDETRVHSGLGFYTSFIGFGILALNITALAIVLWPLATGKPLVKKQYRDPIRFACTALSTLLTLTALSVLMKVTFEFQSMEVRFGIAITLLGNLAAAFYCFLAWQETRRKEVHELFHHPEDSQPLPEKREMVADAPPPPPPPPPSEPESHTYRHRR